MWYNKLSIQSTLHKKENIMMKCYVLKQGQTFSADMAKAKVSSKLEQEILKGRNRLDRLPYSPQKGRRVI